MANDLEAIRSHNARRRVIEHDHCHGYCPVLVEANAEIEALLAEVARLSPVERELADLHADLAAANPGDAIYQYGNEVRHQLGWSLLFLASELGLIDSEGDDCPKPKEYGGAEELLKLVSDEALRLRTEVERLTICRDGSHVGANLVDGMMVCNCGAVGVRLAIDPSSGIADKPRARFFRACAEWADLLVADAIEHVKRDGVRWNFGALDEWMPRIKYELPGSDELIELPEAQAKVWRAGYKLMLDAYDAAKSANKSTELKEENANETK